jgi:hypothetical protein
VERWLEQGRREDHLGGVNRSPVTWLLEGIRHGDPWEGGAGSATEIHHFRAVRRLTEPHGQGSSKKDSMPLKTTEGTIMKYIPSVHTRSD